jgi:hypothetical protein
MLPQNYLTPSQASFATKQISRSCGGNCIQVVCPDALAARLINGRITPITPGTGKNLILSRDEVHYQNNLTATLHSGNPLNAVIAVVLESPHKAEYIGNPIAPAKGRTGLLFFKKFDALFQKSKLGWQISPNSIYNIVLVNSVQYQTSCGLPLSGKKNRANKQRRDCNWESIFRNGSARDLQKRLSALKPILVLNLCTGGLNRTHSLQSMVDVAIKQQYQGRYTTGCHPSSWFSPNAYIR